MLFPTFPPLTGAAAGVIAAVLGALFATTFSRDLPNRSHMGAWRTVYFAYGMATLAAVIFALGGVGAVRSDPSDDVLGELESSVVWWGVAAVGAFIFIELLARTFSGLSQQRLQQATELLSAGVDPAVITATTKVTPAVLDVLGRHATPADKAQLLIARGQKTKVIAAATGIEEAAIKVMRRTPAAGAADAQLEEAFGAGGHARGAFAVVSMLIGLAIVSDVQDFLLRRQR